MVLGGSRRGTSARCTDARRGVRGQLKGHGIGLHSQEEIHAIGSRDFARSRISSATSLFSLGDTPTEIDAIAYGQLPNIMSVPIESPVKDAALTHANLVAYVERVKNRVFA